MKIIVNTKEIQTAFKNLIKVTPSKPSIPILGNIKLSVSEASAELIARDIELTVTLRLKDVEIIEPGEIVITKETIKLVSKLNDYNMTITDREIISGKRNVKYTGIDAETYPEKPNREYNQNALTLSKEKMMDIVSITYACAETNSSNHVLSGLCFRNAIVTACDRHRIATKTIENNEYGKDLNIAAYALNLIPALTDKQYKGEYVFTVENDRYIQIKFDNVTMEVRMIDGVYPDTSKIIPQSFKTEAKVNRLETIEELKVLKEVVTDKIKLVTINVTEGKVNLYAKSKGNGNSLSCDLESNVTGDNITIACNPEFIIEALSNNSGKYVTFRFVSETSPFMIDTDTLILPYRVNNKKAA